MHYRNGPEPTVCGGSNVTVLPKVAQDSLLVPKRNSSMKNKGQLTRCGMEYRIHNALIRL